MSTFTAEAYQNEYLALGATEVNAVVTVTASNGGMTDGAGTAHSTGAAEIVIVERVRVHGEPAGQAARREGRHGGRNRLHPRRRHVRRDRRQHDRHPRLPLLRGAHARIRCDAGGREASSRPAEGKGRNRDRFVARSREATLRGLTRGDLPRNPPHRRPGRARDARGPRARAGGMRRGGSTVRLPRSRHRLAGRRAAIHRNQPCSERSTSSPSPPAWPTTSKR